MANRIIVSRLATTMVGAALLCGCGTASIGSGSVPAGFTVYRGDGFSVAAPRGFQALPLPTNIPGLPAAASGESLTARVASPGTANAQVLAVKNPSLQVGIDKVVTSLRNGTATDPTLSDVHTSARTVTVTGAQEARIVTQSWHLTSEPSQGTIQRTWLMVLPKPGTLIDVIVTVEPARGGHLDPNTVFDSFRLDQ